VVLQDEELYLFCDAKPGRFILEFIVSKNYHIVLLDLFWFSKADCLLCVLVLARTEYEAFCIVGIYVRTRYVESTWRCIY
jgi:hypothetical protein